jgi:hypothetical protein
MQSFEATQHTFPMDIDNQDELLVEYDDGDAQMGVDPDAEVIVVEEGDAEMVDEEENIGESFCLSVFQRLLLTFRR